jgi:hypothetical protein
MQIPRAAATGGCGPAQPLTKNCEARDHLPPDWEREGPEIGVLLFPPMKQFGEAPRMHHERIR